MLKLLQAGSLSRLQYAIVLIAVLAFDFAKDPIRDLIINSKTAVQDQVYSIGGAQLKAKFEDITLPAEPGLTAVQRQQRMQDTQLNTGELVAGAVAMEATSSAIGAFFISLLIAIGVASYLVLIWMVFARLRDTELPQWVGFGVLALPVSMRLFHASMSDVGWDIATAAVIISLIALTFIPSKAVPTIASARLGSPTTVGRLQRSSFGTRR